MNSLVRLFHAVEDAGMRVARLNDESWSLLRSLERFAIEGKRVPRVLMSASEKNCTLLEQANLKHQAVKSNLDAALAAFDSTVYEARLEGEIASLENVALGFYNDFARADKKIGLAKKNGWAVPKDAVRIVEDMTPRIEAACEQVNRLYQFRTNRYELVKYYAMLDSLMERIQQDQTIGTAHIKFLGVEHTAKRSRTCKGKRFKDKPREPRRPKNVQAKPAKKDKDARGQKRDKNRKAA